MQCRRLRDRSARDNRQQVSVDYGVVNHWDLICKHKHQPPVSHWGAWASSETFLSSVSPCAQKHTANRARQCGFFLRKQNSVVPHLSKAPFRMLELQALSWRGRDWGAVTVLIRTGDQGDVKPFTSSWQVEMATLPSAQMSKKRKAKHCFGYTQHIIHLSTTTTESTYTK